MQCLMLLLPRRHEEEQCHCSQEALVALARSPAADTEDDDAQGLAGLSLHIATIFSTNIW